MIGENEARINVTFGGENGDLPDPVRFDANDGDIKQWVTEAVRAGDIPGMRADANADFRDHIVERYTATEARPYALVQVRPKTAFGG